MIWCYLILKMARCVSIIMKNLQKRPLYNKYKVRYDTSLGSFETL